MVNMCAQNTDKTVDLCLKSGLEHTREHTNKNKDRKLRPLYNVKKITQIILSRAFVDVYSGYSGGDKAGKLIVQGAYPLRNLLSGHAVAAPQ